MSELTARLDLPLGLHAPAAARQAVTGVLYGWGYHDQDWLDGAAVLASELVTNAVRHGGGSVELALRLHEQLVTMSLVDGASVVPGRPGDGEAGRRALAVIEALAARWGVRDHEGGKQVWAELPQPAVQPPQPPGTEREAVA